jgi:hypothetical protein
MIHFYLLMRIRNMYKFNVLKPIQIISKMGIHITICDNYFMLDSVSAFLSLAQRSPTCGTCTSGGTSKTCREYSWRNYVMGEWYLYVMSCHVMSCHVMLCYVMLCYVMLCYVMLCYVMLCLFSVIYLESV